MGAVAADVIEWFHDLDDPLAAARHWPGEVPDAFVSVVRWLRGAVRALWAAGGSATFLPGAGRLVPGAGAADAERVEHLVRTPREVPDPELAAAATVERLALAGVLADSVADDLVAHHLAPDRDAATRLAARSD